MRRFLQFLVVIGGVAFAAEGANVVLDGTMGEVEPLTGTRLEIAERFGYRPKNPGSDTLGPNLFHSFKYFSLSNGDTAVFTGSGGINNVLARVTGPEASMINGKIQSTIPGANLFLINPRGVIFGSGASLDIGGSFVATTADFVRLADGGRFDAVDRGQMPLTVAPPAAFGFLSANPEAVSVSGKLDVIKARSVSLIGGDVSLDGAEIDVADGDLHMVSARGPGEVAMDFRSLRPTPSLGAGTSGGDVRLSSATLGDAGTTRKVVIRGGKLTTVDSVITAVASEPGDGISVRISEDITATGANFFSTTTRGELVGQDVVEIVAKDATLSDETTFTAFTEEPSAKGDVHLAISGKLEISGFSGVSNVSGGDVRIEADSMLVTAGGTVVTSYGDFTPAGDIRIDVAGRLDITEGGFVAVDQSSSQSSDIFIKAREVFISGELDGQAAGVQATLVGGGDGPGGLIRFDVSGRLELRDGGRVQATTVGGNGARVEIAAAEVLMVNDGIGQDTGIFAGNRSSPERSGGAIRMDISGWLTLLGGAAISSDTRGLGPGGEIDISAQRVVIEGRGIEHGSLSVQGINARNRTQGDSGASGDIRISVRDGLELRGGGEILTTSYGSGLGGNISVMGRDVVMVDGSLIAAETLAATGGGSGGSVSMVLGGRLAIGEGSRISVATFGSGAGGSADLRVGELALAGPESAILASSSGAGRGGGISIMADEATISERGRIVAETTGRHDAGAGGDVLLAIGDSLILSGGGVVSVASFGSGAAGNIQIRTGQLAVSGSGSAIVATANESGAGGNIAIIGDDAVLTRGGRIVAETLAASGAGAGGDIRLEFQDEVEIETGSRISAATFGSGLGGSIEVRADRLVIDGAGSAITAQSLGAPVGGNGGNLVLKLGELSLEDGGAILVSSAGSGRAGAITVEAKRRVVLTGGSSITAAALLSSGGEIAINGGARIEIENSRITAEANTKGGNIRLVSRDILDLFKSQITAAANTDGGNIFIDPQFVLLNRSLISANAVVGRGGNIRIFADYFIASPDSLVTASSERGINGEVRINAINVDLTGNIVELPATFLPAESLLRELCTIKLQDFSSFIVEGRGGLAPVPGDWVSSLEPELPRKDPPDKP